MRTLFRLSFVKFAGIFILIQFPTFVVTKAAFLAPFFAAKHSFQRVLHPRKRWSIDISSSSREEEEDASLVEPWMEDGGDLRLPLHPAPPPELESAVLNQKLHALQLSDQKLLVLQDAAKRMVRRHEAELLETKAQHATALAANEATAQRLQNAEIDRLQLMWERRLRSQKDADRQVAAKERAKLQEDWQAQLQKAQREYQARIEEMQAEQARDRSEREQRLRAQMAAIERDAAKEVHQANSTIQLLQAELREERERHRLAELDCVAITERFERLQSRFDHLRQQNEALLLQQQSEQQELARQQEEQMEIANSAVAAAMHREQELQKKYELLQQQYDTLQSESITRQQLRPKKVTPSSFADSSKGVAPSSRRRGMLDLIWNAKAVRFFRHWFQYLLVPRAPSSFRKRKSTSSPPSDMEQN